MSRVEDWRISRIYLSSGLILIGQTVLLPSLLRISTPPRTRGENPMMKLAKDKREHPIEQKTGESHIYPRHEGNAQSSDLICMQLHHFARSHRLPSRPTEAVFHTVIGIATRGWSVGRGFDELASQRESGDVGKELRHNSCVSFRGGYARAHCKLSQHACLFRGYLWVNHRTSVLSTVPSPPVCASSVCYVIRLRRG